jgi:hypothetical protein
MPTVHRLVLSVRGEPVAADFSEDDCAKLRQKASRRLLALPGYRQLDEHSCGFLAVLAVVHHFSPHVPSEDVLRVVRPSAANGCDQRRVVDSLRRHGVAAEYREGLGLRRLHGLMDRGAPVIVTMWPEWSACDHWTVVRGIDLDRERVFLTNYGPAADEGSMPWSQFVEDWYPRGGGLVCRELVPSRP